MAATLFRITLVALALAGCTMVSSAQEAKNVPIITTIAGTGSPGHDGDGGPPMAATINRPYDVAVSAIGDVYIAERDNHVIRKISRETNLIETVVGTGVAGFFGDGSNAKKANLRDPNDVEILPNGDLLFVDTGNHRVRIVDANTGKIRTIAGTGEPGFAGNGGPATEAQLRHPVDATYDPIGNIYIADEGNHVVRRIDAETGILSAFAGTGIPGFSGDGGPAKHAQIWTPRGVASDRDGNIYIASWDNNRVRKVDSNKGLISTFAGTGDAGYSGDGELATVAELYKPSSIAIDKIGNVFVADVGNTRIRRIDHQTKIISTVAFNGTGVFGGDGGPAIDAGPGGFLPYGIAIDSQGDLYITDTDGHRIRFVTASVLNN